ncbi:MAG: hypothetical protein H8K07_01530 [Nitrospira sp.]|nr:hypothetical protein [Nitrospira sp.]
MTRSIALRQAEVNSAVLIQADKVCLCGPTDGEPTVLAEYSQQGALLLGYELIEAALKLRHKLKQGRPRKVPLSAEPCPMCGKAVRHGHLYCSKRCYFAKRYGHTVEAPIPAQTEAGA